jgi:hypothetical protein
MQSRLRFLPILAAALLAPGLSSAQGAPKSTAPAPASTPVLQAPATTSVITLKLKLDAVAELAAGRTKLDGSLSVVKSAAKGKNEWREGVVLFAAAEAARKDGNNTVAYKKLVAEANTRFDLARTLAGGGAGTSAGLTALKADATVGKYLGTLDKDLPVVDTLLSTSTAWAEASVNGKRFFEPETF